MSTILRGPLRTAWGRCIAAWDSAQVELHGLYSVRRLEAVLAYGRGTTTPRVLGLLGLTPLPCLAAVALADAIPLRDPGLGIAHSQGFWVRAVFATWIYCYSTLEQLRGFVRGLPLTGWSTLWLSLPVTALTNVVTFLLACRFGFPLPFTIPVLSVPWSVFMVAALWLRLRAFFRAHPEAIPEVGHYVLVMLCQVSLILIYPAYNAIFVGLPPRGQTAIALLLPAIKLLEKNLLSFFLRRLDDLKPEAVVFNVEVFNALFVACCMQNSSSTGTNVVLVAVDFVMACIALRDLDGMLVEVTRLTRKMGITHDEVLTTALEISRQSPHLERQITVRWKEERLERARTRKQTGFLAILWGRKPVVHPGVDNNVKTSAHRQQQASQSAKTPPSTIASDAVIPGGGQKLTSVSPAPFDQPFPIAPVSMAHAGSDSVRLVGPHVSALNTEYIATKKSTGTRALKGITKLDEDERRLFLQKVLQTLHLIEYLLLIEYTEVMIPLVYSLYLCLLYRLPNRVYYPQLAHIDVTQLWHTIGNVMMNATCELVSLVLLSTILRRKLRISPFRILAFVLHCQWRMVQSKLILWVVVTLQSTLYHLGADYTFQFKWLHSDATSST